jgi:hypothetical protein
MIESAEVQRGLVTRFDPNRLLENGAAPDCPRVRAVQGVHYFVCVGRFGLWSVWIPAFSSYRPGRIKLGYKSGSSDWVGRDSFVDLEQMWHVPEQAVNPAAAGIDHTNRYNRNFASCRFLLGRSAEQEATA